MAFSYAQIKSGIDFTLEGAEEELLGFVQDLGIQTTDWSVGSPETLNLKLAAKIYHAHVLRSAQIVRDHDLRLSSGSALTSFSDSWYDNERVEARRTQGIMIITGSGGVVPITFRAGELKVTDGNYIYNNDVGFTLSHAVPFVSASVTAEDSGAEYNISSNSSLAFVGTLNGVTVFNPVPEGESTWITTTGVDEESDTTLQTRNRTKWSTFEKGYPTIDRVTQLVLSASSEITHVSIDDQNPRGEFTADVYIAQATETATAAQGVEVQSAINQTFFGNVVPGFTTLVTASIAVEREFNTTFKILYTPTANAAAVISSVSNAANSWVQSIAIGGNDYSPITGSAANLYDLASAIDALDDVVAVSGSLGNGGWLALNKNQKLTSPADWTSVITFVQATTS